MTDFEAEYQGALQWARDNREDIEQAALAGSSQARNVIALHKMLVASANEPTAALFCAAVDDCRNYLAANGSDL